MESSARGHKHNRSSGDLNQSRILEFKTLLETIFGQINILKKHDEFGELEEVQSLAKITESVCNQVRYFKELKAKDSNPNAIVVPLSSVDHDTLEDRLGIKFVSKFESAGLSPEKVLESVRAKIPHQDFGNFEVIRKVVREWDLLHLSKMLNMHSNYVNQKSEASARMVIDNWLMSCLGLARNANTSIRKTHLR
ncbi:hypothetical protein H0H92_006614 [Tricholoma furcatifolium]|nr:hypothetical protein H0H92_006614 [Tricholoma furcatifolium]